MPALRFLALTAVAAATFAVGGGSAMAATCADHAVTARGDPSRFETLAKAKARGNWRAKVRAIPTLGAAYANWSKALAGDYQCSQSGGQYVCIATAHPCHD